MNAISIYRFVQQHGGAWSVDRAVTFGQAVLAYAQSMGLVFTKERDAEIGQVFVFSEAILHRVLVEHAPRVNAAAPRMAATVSEPPPATPAKASPAPSPLADPDYEDMERLLTVILAKHESGQAHRIDLLRATAKKLKLFKRVFLGGVSLDAQRASFGKICVRFSGKPFTSGVSIRAFGKNRQRKYIISKDRRGL